MKMSRLTDVETVDVMETECPEQTTRKILKAAKQSVFFSYYNDMRLYSFQNSLVISLY